MFVNVALVHIYVTLETTVKRCMDQLQDVQDQLHGNVSSRAPVLVSGHAPSQPNSSPAHLLGDVKELGQPLLSVIP